MVVFWVRPYTNIKKPAFGTTVSPFMRKGRMPGQGLYQKPVYLLLLLLPGLLPAQINLYNNSLTDTSLHIIYLGTPNEMVVTGAPDTRNLKLNVRHGDINPDKYRANVFGFYLEDDEYTADTFKVYAGEKLLLKKVFVYRPLGIPGFKVAHSADTVLSMEELVTEPVIEFFPANQYKYPHHQILSFSLDIFRKQQADTLHFYVVDGNRFPEEQTNVLMGLQSGDKIKISNVIAHCTGCRLKLRLRPKTIRIK
jgi:hypothetical protein